MKVRTAHRRPLHALRLIALTLVAPALAGMAADPAAAAVLTPEVEGELARSAYVYIATQRKDGTFGSSAEIWFMWDGGAVWVASPPTTWRVKRIRHGRASARIVVGTRSGPVFTAKGALVRDPAIYERLFATYAKKYPDGWPKFEARFRDGLKDGSRVLVRYEAIAATPTTAASVSAAPAPPSPSPRP